VAKAKNPVWIKGVGFAHDSYVTERSLQEMGSLALAAQSCYKMAGIEDPASQIDLAEVHECFAHEELMAYEALGFCGEGEGAPTSIPGLPAWTASFPSTPREERRAPTSNASPHGPRDRSHHADPRRRR